MIVGPNSHFVHEIGRRNRRHKIAMTEALKPMIVVSWNINKSMRHGEDSKICERVSEMHPLNGTKMCAYHRAEWANFIKIDLTLKLKA